MWFTAAPVWTVKKVYIRKKKKKLGEHIKQHTADTASNQSVIHEYYKLTGHHLDKDNVTVLCLEEKTVPRKVREAIYTKRELGPILNRDRGVNCQDFTILDWQHLVVLGASWSPQNHSYPEKMFPSNVLISLEAEKNPLSLIKNPHKSPFRNFFYDHSKVELFSFLCSNFYKKILSITRQRKDATAVAQLTLILNARVSDHKCHTHSKLDVFWYRFTKQVLKIYPLFSLSCKLISKDTVNI